MSFSIDATSLAPIDLFQAMNVAWNMGIPWEGTATASLPALTFRRVLEIGTLAGARALGLGDEVGSLTPGKAADILLIRADDLNVGPLAAVESAIVRTVTPANVDSVLVGGSVREARRPACRDRRSGTHARRDRVGGADPPEGRRPAGPAEPRGDRVTGYDASVLREGS